MMCDSLERRRAQLQQRVGGKTTSFRQRPYISDRELVEQLLKLEREMEQEERNRLDAKVADR